MKTVCVTGVDGSGKSTQIASLARRLGENGQSVQRMSIWDGLASKTIRGKIPFQSREHVYRYLAALTPLSRAYFLFHALRVSLDLAVTHQWDVLLLDGYWYKYYATEVAHGGDRDTVRAMAAGFPEPDVTFYLTVDSGQAGERKSERSDYESGYGERFDDFQCASKLVLDALAIELRWPSLDGARTPELITEDIMAGLEARGKGDV